MLALTLFTAVQRFVKVWNQASVERPVPARAARRTRRRRVPRATAADRRATWRARSIERRHQGRR